ncbi:uncharacterized protein TNCV_898071 [Trichonephila clavipes]|nr:uncharacterized protein TNCV_898071 [Trichonephila clavipes]
MVRWALKLAEFNIEWEHRLGIQNAVANVFSTNPIEIIIGEKVHCAIIRDLVLSLRDQLIEEQRTDPEVISINIWKTQKIAQLMRQYASDRSERVNRDLVQMIANYVNEQHDTGDQFLREFAYAIRTAVNETTGKPPAELFLGRKLITPFQKLVMVSDGTEFAIGDIER